jgi:hypothetical protein
MPLMALLNSTRLDQWADQREAQDTLPRLVRRLVATSNLKIRRLDFPAGESVQFGGWDGLLTVEDGNAFIPRGTSAWEFGTGADIRRKANEDYQKRTENPLSLNRAETVFIFVTPRKWASKAEWIKERKAEAQWREVRAYDAADLEAWLEQSPSVQSWFSRLLHLRPSGVRDLEGFWSDWSQATRPALSPDILTTDRDAQVSTVVDWLSAPASLMSLKGDSSEESLAFLASILARDSNPQESPHFARAIIVDDAGSWDELAATQNPLILIPMFQDRSNVNSAVRFGHHVYVPLTRENVSFSTMALLPRQHREKLKTALLDMGISESRVETLATLARRSLGALRRKLAVAPELLEPVWAKPGLQRTVLPAMLAGAWRDTNEADRTALANLSSMPYDEFSRNITTLENTTDPPLRREGDLHMVVSKDDALTMLAHLVLTDDLDALERVALNVLGEIDPIWDCAPEEQSMARIRDIKLQHSNTLRKGLADTLALIGARSDSFEFADGSRGQARADRIVRKLLVGATDWRLWATLSDVLPLLAEASPSAFLDAVDAHLMGTDPTLGKIFIESDVTFGPGSPHTGLLWALELLAWHPDYLSFASMQLAKLSLIDPGGKLTNRPANSLHQIFLPWLPQTLADVKQRLKVIGTMRKRFPPVAWSLMCSLLPVPHGISHPTHSPEHRDWLPEEKKPVLMREFWQFTHQITIWLIDDTSNDGHRWIQLLEAFTHLESDRTLVLDALQKLDPANLTVEHRLELWKALQKTISTHTEFADADWALPPADIDRLSEQHARFAPTDPIQRYAWLFTNYPPIIGVPRDEFELQDQTIKQLQIDAVNTIWEHGGLVSIYKLAQESEFAGIVGKALGLTDLLSDGESAFLTDNLGNDDEKRSALARGFLAGHVSLHGWAWIEHTWQTQSVNWSPKQREDFLLCLVPTHQVLDWVNASDVETQERYWKSIGQYSQFEDPDLQYIIEKLIEYGRPHAAVGIMSNRLDEHKHLKVPTSLALLALRDMTRTKPEPHEENQMSAYHVDKVLDALRQNPDVTEEQLVNLEWIFLAIFGHRGRSPKTLEKSLATNPKFFAEVLSYCYKSEHGENPPLNESEQRFAVVAYHLLDEWKRLPGLRDDNSLDAEVLHRWVNDALAATTAVDRKPVGEQQIGQLLAFSPMGTDGAWPHEAIREILEDAEGENLARGFSISTYNQRGVTSRSPTDGGKLERAEAARYADFAKQIVDESPRTAAILREIAEGYEIEAKSHDHSASLTQDNWR